MAGSDGGYIWFWYGDDGEWKIFTEDQQDKIERARIQGEDQVMLHRGPTTYSLDLVNKFQTNTGTNHQRPISAARANTVWFWKDDDGHTWNCYDREDAEKLTQAETGREDSVILMIGRTPYYVDLARRFQKNVLTEFARDICQGKPPRRRAAAASADKGAEEEEDSDDMNKAAPDSFICPVSFKIMGDPVTNAAGSTYDRKAIEWWWQKHDTDPLTMAKISDKYLIPNKALKDAIDQWKVSFLNKDKKPAAVSTTAVAQTTLSRQSTPQLSTSRQSTAQSALGRQISAQSPLRVQRAASAPSNEISYSERVSMPLDHSFPSDVAAHSNPFSDTAVESLRDTVNETLKIVILGNNKVGATSIARKLVYGRNASVNKIEDSGTVPPGVNILEWDPVHLSNSANHSRTSAIPIKFNIWDFVGRDTFCAFRSLFFSSHALYILVWDMGVSNPAAARQQDNDARADEALERDIYDKVLSWVDLIQSRVPYSVILPIASHVDYFNNDKKSSGTAEMGEAEAKRRCKVLRSKLLLHNRRHGKSTIIFEDGEDPILRVSGFTTTGLDVLTEKIISVGRDASIFGHIGKTVPENHLRIRSAIRSMKHKGCKGVDVSRLRDVVTDDQEISKALNWLCNSGELLYFGGTHDLEHLSQSVILDIRWFVELAGCMLRHNLEAIVKDTRRLNRKSSKGATPDGNTQYFDGAYLICPLISSGDVYMLWQRTEGNSNAPSATNDGLSTLKLYKFMQMLLVHVGVIVPVNEDIGPYCSDKICSSELSEKKYMKKLNGLRPSNAPHMFFLPGLLDEGDHGEDLDFYKIADGSKTTLAQSVQFFSRVPADLMESIIVAVLRQINAIHSSHREKQLGMQVKSFQCWRSIFFLKLRMISSNHSGNTSDSIVEICTQLVDRNSRRCIGSEHVDERIKACLIISAKGPAADCGIDIWKGGYGLVAETARAIVELHSQLRVEYRSFCTQCLARNEISTTHSWSLNEMRHAVKKKESKLRCGKGHKIDACLLTGTGQASGGDAGRPNAFSNLASKDAHTLSKVKESVVLVGLYDGRKRANKICTAGSGFVIDRERGLIVTAARNVLKIAGEDDFGADYLGIEGAKIVVGLIPDKKDKDACAIFRYYATICSKDPALADGYFHVDACVLQITARFESDVDGNGDACAEEINIPLRGRPELIKQQGLRQLELAEPAGLEEPVCILGFEQKDDSTVHRSLSVVSGYVCQQKQDSSGIRESDKFQWRPKRTTVLMCPAKPGHVGGPCINRDGNVIGILSCADPHEKSRCFVVPCSELKPLLPSLTPRIQRPSSLLGTVFKTLSHS